MRPKFSSIAHLQSLLRSGETTCRAIVEHYLAQIEQNKQLNAYVEVFSEEARAKADALDARPFIVRN